MSLKVTQNNPRTSNALANVRQMIPKKFSRVNSRAGIHRCKNPDLIILPDRDNSVLKAFSKILARAEVCSGIGEGIGAKTACSLSYSRISSGKRAHTKVFSISFVSGWKSGAHFLTIRGSPGGHPGFGVITVTIRSDARIALNLLQEEKVLSSDQSPSSAMKAIKSGACYYMIKPISEEALGNIWQHAWTRKLMNEKKNNHESSCSNMDDYNNHHYNNKQLVPYYDHNNGDETQLCTSLLFDDSSREAPTKRNSINGVKEEDEGELLNNDEPLPKKRRVVWSDELHDLFVRAVNQLGEERAVPKAILELMNVPGLHRENVASHLQKYRLHLKRKNELDLDRYNHHHHEMNNATTMPNINSTTSVVSSEPNLERSNMEITTLLEQVCPPQPINVLPLRHHHQHHQHHHQHQHQQLVLHNRSHPTTMDYKMSHPEHSIKINSHHNSNYSNVTEVVASSNSSEGPNKNIGGMMSSTILELFQQGILHHQQLKQMRHHNSDNNNNNINVYNSSLDNTVNIPSGYMRVPNSDTISSSSSTSLCSVQNSSAFVLHEDEVVFDQVGVGFLWNNHGYNNNPSNFVDSNCDNLVNNESNVDLMGDLQEPSPLLQKYSSLDHYIFMDK
ncbi:two-component response regulator ORR21-like [Senna tora]|uniref:Two-component response regulator ORR21-like n=1 Tax=Senna tora TaxID=362788 RepID=A0A834TSH9_9FABA|nr:two-component response regulator ORR21-like [Senna tora]